MIPPEAVLTSLPRCLQTRLTVHQEAVDSGMAPSAGMSKTSAAAAGKDTP